MTTQSLVQSKVNYGFAKVAANLGAPYNQYRPTTNTNPISPTYLLGTVMMAVDTDAKLTFSKPRVRAKQDDFYAAVDTSLVQIGDYLTLNGDTFFLSALGLYTPVRLTLCTSTFNVFRPVPQTPGNGYYGGDVVSAGEMQLATAWPAAIIQGTKGEKGEVNLPGDTRLPWYWVMIPAIPGLQFRTGDILVDNQAITQRFTVSSTELTSMGWRLSAALATP